MHTAQQARPAAPCFAESHMSKAEKPKAAAKPRNKKDQYERFQQTARDLGIDDEESAHTFERAFKKIVPVKHPAKEPQ